MPTPIFPVSLFKANTSELINSPNFRLRALQNLAKEIVVIPTDYMEASAKLLFTYGVVERIRGMLSSEVYSEIRSRPSCLLSDDLRKLKKSLCSLCALFPCLYEKLHNTNGTEDVNTVHILRGVLCDIEDLLDLVATEQLEGEVNRRDNLHSATSFVGAHVNPKSYPYDLASVLKHLLHKLDDIIHSLGGSDTKGKKPSFERSDYHLAWKERIADKSFIPTDFYPNATAVGRELDKELIIKYISKPIHQTHPVIISVFGEPGIGKTTLAKLVCNDFTVSSSFDLVLLALVSRIRPSNLKSTIAEIIRPISPPGRFYPQNMDMESLKASLRGILQDRKYLLVLDDFRVGESTVWVELMELLKVGSTGSAIILISTWELSTRVITCDKSFELKGLSREECWSLFTRCAALDEEARRKDPALELIGRSIVEKCHGNPLAIKTLGSTLRIVRDKYVWKQIDENTSWSSSNAADAALAISMENMTYGLMQCIVSSIVLREDKVICKDQLVYFWMAQGLLQSGKENEDLRDIGDRYFNELYSKSFIQSYHGGSSCFGIFHIRNEMHDLAINLMERRIEFIRAGIFLALDRHVQWQGVLDSPDEEFPWDWLSSIYARTFLFNQSMGPISKPFLESLIFHLSRARVLLLDHCEFMELPEAVGHLKLLRYLSIAGNRKLQVLPESICKLVNLQTLDLSGCVQLNTLPKFMDKLVRLRHLILSVKLPTLPDEALKSWSSLHLLKICNCLNLNSLSEGIANLTNLRVLQINGCPLVESLPNSIRCLTKLKELRVQDCETLDLTRWDGLDGLIGIQLLQLQGLPNLTEFPKGLQSVGGSLQHLVISSCENLKALPECLQKCSNLLELVIDACPNIATLPKGIQAVKTLQILKILNCPELIARCECGIGEDWHLISHILQIHLDHKLIQYGAASTLQKNSGGMPSSHSNQEFVVPRPFSPPSNGPAQFAYSVSSDSSSSSSHDEQSERMRRKWLAAEGLTTRSMSPWPLRRLSRSDQFPMSFNSQDYRSGPQQQSIEKATPFGLQWITTTYPSIEKATPITLFGMSLDPKGALSDDSLPGWRQDVSPNLPKEKEDRGGDRVELPLSIKTAGPSPSTSPSIQPLCSTWRLVNLETKTKSKGYEYLECEETEDELLPSIVPNSEFQNFSTGILFLYGEDYEFEKDKLIQLWIAGGLIENEPMEINGANYFEILMSEGYILHSHSDSMYKVNCAMVNSRFNMLSDKSRYLRLESDSQNNAAAAEILHVSVVDDDMIDTMFKTLDRFAKLRTLLFMGTCSSRLEKVLLELFLSFGSLVVLDLSGTDVKELPSSTGKMINLRYLDLSWTFIELLPSAICWLDGLQTLRLKGCSRLWRLPSEMERLAKLRHLDFDILGQLAIMPKRIGSLVNLRTLSAFLIDTEEGCKITELRDLNYLTGEFCIARLEHVQSAVDARLASLSAKKHLKKLELRWGDSSLQETKDEGISNRVLENLCPPLDLEELHIQSYPGTNLPSWIADEAFQKLARVTLFKCEHVFVLFPSMQKLPSLEYLRLISLISVIKLDFGGQMDYSAAFPKLKALIIDKMLNLETWIESKDGDFPCLAELTIRYCPNLCELPSLVYLSSMKHLEISSCPRVQFMPEKELSLSLEHLMVGDCPLIQESYSKQEDQFLEKIKHVPNIWIDQDDDSKLLDDDEYTNDSDDTEELS